MTDTARGENTVPESTDAVVWTREWLNTITEHPTIPTDEVAMIGWFANAIMAGHDAAVRRYDPSYSESIERVMAPELFYAASDCRKREWTKIGRLTLSHHAVYSHFFVTTEGTQEPQ